MREIKAIVYQGNIVRLAQTNYSDSVQAEAFQRNNGMAVQQFAYNCSMQQDNAGVVYGMPSHVLMDFTVCVMQAQQNIFYEKLMEKSTEQYSFLFNAVFERDKLKAFDNAIMVEGYIVEVEECGSNEEEQALIKVKLLASELTYLHKNNEELILTISK